MKITRPETPHEIALQEAYEYLAEQVRVEIDSDMIEDMLAMVEHRERDYLALCRALGEEPVLKNNGRPDFTSVHARRLEALEGVFGRIDE